MIDDTPTRMAPSLRSCADVITIEMTSKGEVAG